MTTVSSFDNARFSILCALGASFVFSVNDIAVRSFSSSLPLHEVILFRATIGLIFTMVVFVPRSAILTVWRTNNLRVQLIRGGAVVLSNFAYFAGLAVLPLAEASAIFFIAPLIITAFSAIFLREYVGIRRWLALMVGLFGVMLIVKPGTVSFQWAVMLPVVAATAYAAMHTLTRKIGQSDSAVTSSVYIQAVFIVVSMLMGIMFGNGWMSGNAHPAIAFVFRAWEMPEAQDFLVFLVAGICSSTGGYLITQAYRSSAAGLVAPFEYSSLVLAAFWGFILWSEIPGLTSTMGILLIMGSGIFVALREARQSLPASAKRSSGRR